jgi:hypothetical protein
MSAKRPLEERFWAKVNQTETCWLWTASTTTFGYGVIGRGGKGGGFVNAHRLSWQIHFGDIPKGLCVLHRCDVPACVRPDHLWLGTKKENSLDAVAKGRWRHADPTQCKRGHLYDAPNTIWQMSNGKRYRVCRTCARAANRRHEQATRKRLALAY